MTSKRRIELLFNNHQLNQEMDGESTPRWSAIVPNHAKEEEDDEYKHVEAHSVIQDELFSV